MLAVDVVKRDGERPTEQYERAKLQRSIQAVLQSVNTPDGQASDTAHAVCDLVEQWLATRAEVTSNDLRKQTTIALTPFHPEAAFIYQRHKIMF